MIIRERLGVASNFFHSDCGVPELTANLCHFARFAYLDNPLPSLFKERTATYLSRFCEVRYCLARHVAFLTGRGHVAGDPHCAPQTVHAALRLLRQPLVSGTALNPSLAVLAACEAPMAELPDPDTPQEQAVLACIAHLFLHTEDAPAARNALRRVLGATRFDYLDVLLAFMQTSHDWTRNHPEIVFEDDVRALLATHETLAACVLNDPVPRFAGEPSSQRQEREPADEELGDRELSLRAALAAGHMGTWQWNVQSAEWIFDASLRRLFGLQSTVRCALDEFVQVIHPDDRAHAAQAFRLSATQGVDLDIEFRTIQGDGTVRWFDCHGAVFTESRGEPGVFLAGACVDVTDRKRSEERIRDSEQRYRNLLDSIDEAFAIAEMIEPADVGGSIDFRCIDANPAFNSLSMLADSVGATLRGVLPNIEDVWIERYVRVLRTGEPVRFQERVASVDKWYDVFASRVGGPGSRRIAALFTDITPRKHAEAALKESETRSRNILESITDGFIALDAEWRVTYVNPQAERLLARPAGHLIGQVLWASYPGLAGSAFEKTYRSVARDHEASSVTAFYPDRDSWYEAHVYPAASGITVYFSDVTERVRAQEALTRAMDDLEMRVAERTRELQQANALLRSEIAERERAEADRLELLQKLVSAQEEERRRISRELHDSLGEHLTALTIGLNAMAKEPARLEPSWIERLRETTLRLDEELERLSHELRPPALDDLGLDAALHRHIAAWSRLSGIKVDAQIRGIGWTRLPVPIETTVYRIAQEALTNIQKHARATQVSLIAERRNRELRVVIEDNGAGFEPDNVLSDRGARRLGLRGMAERAALVAGKLEVESRPGEGATIYLSIPLDDAAIDTSC